MTPSAKIELLRNMKAIDLFVLCLNVYENATDLFDTAELVFGHSRYNMTYFLALTASEEFAKAIVIGEYALLKKFGKLTEKIEETHLQMIDKSLRLHEIKYEFLEKLLIIEPPSDFAGKGSSGETEFLSSGEIEVLSSDKIEALSEWFVDMLVAANETYLKFLNENRLKELSNKQLAKRWEMLKKKRNDTLYVDIRSIEGKTMVKTPFEMTRLDAIMMMLFASELIDETSGWFILIKKLLEIEANER